MVHFYKGHEIRITAIEVKRGRWYSDIVILWQEGQTSVNRPCTIRRMFDTASQAENHSFILVKNWIDDGKPAVIRHALARTA